MMICSFVIHTEPVGKGRPRFTRDGHAYTPERTRRFEAAVRAAALDFMKRMGTGRIPADIPISVHVVACFRIPTSWTKRKKAAASEQIPRIDVDNILKAVLDGMNGILFEDDRQVVKAVAEKRYEEEDRVLVFVHTPEEKEVS